MTHQPDAQFLVDALIRGIVRNDEWLRREYVAALRFCGWARVDRNQGTCSEVPRVRNGKAE